MLGHGFKSREEDALKPTLASFEALEVLEALALISSAAKIEFLDVFVVAQFIGGAVEHDLALFHDVAMAGDGQRSAGVLLDKQNRHAQSRD